MENENIKIVEINGVKIEVDLRTAKVVENYKVGDMVKVLVKKYSDTWESYAGVIIGFDDFKNLPTIIVAYMESSYSAAEIKFSYLNSASQGLEICPSNSLDKFLDKSHALGLLDMQINRKIAEVDDLKSKREYFLKEFQCYFGEVKV